MTVSFFFSFLFPLSQSHQSQFYVSTDGDGGGTTTTSLDQWWKRFLFLSFLCSFCVQSLLLGSAGAVVILERLSDNREEYTSLCCWSLLYSTVLCSWEDSLQLHVILHEWLAFYSTFFSIHQSGVFSALAWLVPHETVAVSFLHSVYTIQPCTMLHQCYTGLKNV